jgi:hypothetical protein
LKNERRVIKVRSFVSVMLMIFFVFVAVSGIIIHPAHTVQHAGVLVTDHDNFVLKRCHEWAGYTLIILGAIHLLFNRSVMLRHISWRKGG